MRKISDSELKNVQLMILDLDGTLLNREGKLPLNIKNSIDSLLKMGVYITFASGRVHSSIIKYAILFDIDIPLISLDGALVKNKSGNVILHKAVIRPSVVKKAIKYAETNLIQIGLCHEDEIFHNEDSAALPMILEKAGAKYTEVNNFEKYIKDTLEIVCTGDNKKSLEQMARKLKFPFSFGNTVNVFRSRLYPNFHYLECRKAGSSKGNALYKLLKYLKVKEKNVLVAGDWYNDISMFNTDAIKVALKNSIQKIKLKADIILKKSNDEEGLNEILEKIIFLKS